jgi:hypothetical protein
MKKNYKLSCKRQGNLFTVVRGQQILLTISIILLSFSSSYSQSVMRIPSGMDLTLIINGDTTATGTWNERIYELDRDGFYYVSRALNKVGSKLHIRSAPGTGFLPAIFPKQAAGGGWPEVIIQAGDLTLENLYISNNNGAQDKWRGLAVTAANARVEITGCHIENERGAGFMTSAHNVSVFIRDSRFSKMGQRTDPGGNGRVIDTRGHTLDTLVVQNTTFYLVMDRILRTQGGTIDYLVWDHTTGFSHQGRHGALQLGRVNTARVTNNLMINTQYQGDHPGRAEQTQPENDNIYMVTLDEITEGMNLQIRNNNFAWSQNVLDFWASEATTQKPAILTPSIRTAIGEEALADAYFEEYVEFANAPAFPMNYLNALFTIPQPDPFPTWMETDDVGIAFVNCAYADTYTSYTAGDGGFPVGDLNHFPEIKKQWEEAATVSTQDLPLSTIFLSIYPNPASDTFQFTRDVDEVALYNLAGVMVKYLQNTTKVAIGDLPKGVYIVRARSGEGVTTQKLLVQ